MRNMAEDVEIPPSTGTGDNNKPKIQDAGNTSVSNMKNDGQRYEENR